MYRAHLIFTHCNKTNRLHVGLLTLVFPASPGERTVVPCRIHGPLLAACIRWDHTREADLSTTGRQMMFSLTHVVYLMVTRWCDNIDLWNNNCI